MPVKTWTDKTPAGMPLRALVTARAVSANPHVTFVGHATWLNADNALSLIGYDLVLDGSDIFQRATWPRMPAFLQRNR